jgi:hypothetical protein
MQMRLEYMEQVLPSSTLAALIALDQTTAGPRGYSLFNM